MIIPRRPSPCSKCRTVPLCESRCEGNPQHERECAFLRENRRQDDEEPTTADADLITLMRAALLRTHDPGAYERVMALESNKGSKVFRMRRFMELDVMSRLFILEKAAWMVGRRGESAAAEKLVRFW